MTADLASGSSPVSCIQWCTVSFVGIVVISSLAVAQPAPATTAQVTPRPFTGFVENQGQWSTTADYIADFGDLLVRAEPGAIVLQKDVTGPEGVRRGVVRLVFDGSPGLSPRSGHSSVTESHFLLGHDPSRWRRHVPSFTELFYDSVTPGVDVVLVQRHGGFAYDVHVGQTAEVESFVVRCEGVDGMSLAADGSLHLQTPLGPLVQSSPRAWQVGTDGETKPATCDFRLIDETHFGFTVPDRVAGMSVVVDPGLTWSTFLGGAAADWAHKVAVLGSGDVLVFGQTRSLDFPVTPGVYDTTPAMSDAFLTCLDSTGSAVLFSTVFGGADNEVSIAFALSADGSFAIGGLTESADLPTTGASFDRQLSGDSDAFVAKLSGDGAQLLFSTYLGGPCTERVQGLAVTTSGLIVAGGYTCSDGAFPVTPAAFDTTPSGGIDGFVAWFDLMLSGPAQLVSCSFLGGAGSDKVVDLIVGSSDEPILIGSTGSGNFPTTRGAYDETPGGDFITRFAGNGSSLVASTRFKGGHPVTVERDGASILVGGYSFFADALPVSEDAFDTTWNGNSDGFVARFDEGLSSVLAATYIGGIGDDSPSSLAVDVGGVIVLAGITSSLDYPTIPGCFDTEYEGGLGTSMVSCLSADLTELVYSSYLGPATQTISLANDVALLGEADAVIVGEGAKAGFPVTRGAYDDTFNGGDLGGADGYVARMLLKPPPWIDLGSGLAGLNGTPTLGGGGDLTGGTPISLNLANAKALAPVTLVVGLSAANAPFKGGTLVPQPLLMVFGLSTNGQGMLTLAATWPSGLPSGFAFYLQHWIVDPASVAGLAASNGLKATTP